MPIFEHLMAIPAVMKFLLLTHLAGMCLPTIRKTDFSVDRLSKLGVHACLRGAVTLRQSRLAMQAGVMK
jgi:hypothetical protein